MRSYRYSVLIVGLGALMSLAVWPAPPPATAPDDLFVPKCSLPFTDKSVHHPIDTQCSPSGLTTPDSDPDPDPNHQQNRAKNALCAPDPTVPMTVSIFDALQQAVEEKGIPFGNQHIPHPEPLPPDRAALKDLVPNNEGTRVGEGTRVVFVGYVLTTKIGSSESVNCHLPNKVNNDLHIVLGLKPNLLDRVPPAVECESVTAEMIPHFRPAAWDKITFATMLAKLKKRPVRITGHLFFDASHSPCGHPEFRLQGDPKRRSLWEIHPVYPIEVCKNQALSRLLRWGRFGLEILDEWVKNPQ